MPNHRKHRARTKRRPCRQPSGGATPASDPTTSASPPRAVRSTGQKGLMKTAVHTSRRIVDAADISLAASPRGGQAVIERRTHGSHSLPSPVPTRTREQFEAFLKAAHRYPDLPQFRYGYTYYRKYDERFGQPVHNSSDPDSFMPSVSSPRNTSTHRFLPGGKQA